MHTSVFTYVQMYSLIKVYCYSCAYVASGPFDCEAMNDFLSKNSFALWNLTCDQIKLDLVAGGVITYEEKRSMDHRSSPPPISEVFRNITHVLQNKQPKNFKSFLQIMEQSGIPTLEDTAKKLG